MLVMRRLHFHVTLLDHDSGEGPYSEMTVFQRVQHGEMAFRTRARFFVGCAGEQTGANKGIFNTCEMRR